MAKINRLGRGLDALIDMGTSAASGTSSINEVPLSLIKPNPNQPRQLFNEETLGELASSIKELGVIAPITLRSNEDGTYLIIAGERRYRASLKVGLKTIPAYIKTAADEEVVEMALIENIQREDLNAIEIALTYYRLMNEYDLTQDRLSERVGKRRATISNYVRLLKLPAEVQMGVKDKKIEMGHAKALLGVDSTSAQLKLYQLLLKNRYSVRKLEQMVRNYNEIGKFENSARGQSNSVANLPEYVALKKQLTQTFQTKVQLSCDKKGKGRITIPFADDNQLMEIMKLLDNI